VGADEIVSLDRSRARPTILVGTHPPHAVLNQDLPVIIGVTQAASVIDRTKNLRQLADRRINADRRIARGA